MSPPVSPPQPQSLAQFGRPKIDGELKVSSTERRSKVDRWDRARGHHGDTMGTPGQHRDAMGTSENRDTNGDTPGTCLSPEQGTEREPLQGRVGTSWGTRGSGGTSATPVPVPRYGFLLDKALIICKRRGDSYEAKEVVDLQSHQLRDGGLGPRDGKKVPRDTGVPPKNVWPGPWWPQMSSCQGVQVQ